MRHSLFVLLLAILSGSQLVAEHRHVANEQRTQPHREPGEQRAVGRASRHGGEQQQAAAPTVAASPEPEPAATAMTGQQVYEAACNLCHGVGVGGAPITGDVAVWAPRIAQGIDVLNDHAVNGFDGDAPTPMLAKGGRAEYGYLERSSRHPRLGAALTAVAAATKES